MSATRKMWAGRLGWIGSAIGKIISFMRWNFAEIFLTALIVFILLAPLMTGQGASEVTRYRLAFEMWRSDCVAEQTKEWVNASTKAMTYNDLVMLKGRCDNSDSKWWYPFDGESGLEAQRKVVGHSNK